ncbi:MAG TPA: hypothetical protein VNK96_02740 [Fimbriimonadales bacterium]|nr:hypothetical protein [Fimbriimonadales bacterium]
MKKAIKLSFFTLTLLVFNFPKNLFADGYFVWVGTLVEDEVSVLRGISDNGMVAVGNAVLGNKGTVPVQWTEFTGLEPLTTDVNGIAYNVSEDGKFIVGEMSNGAFTEAFRWTSEGGLVGLGDLPGGSFRSIAWGVSGDGSIVVGESNSANGIEAFRWTESDGMQGLGDLAGGGFFSAAYGVSADGSTIVGQSMSSKGTEAFRWTSSGGMQGLGDLGSGSYASAANAVSADGSVIVGVASPGSEKAEAFRWTAEEGMQGLGYLPEVTNYFYSTAWAVSGDGTVIVGQCFTTIYGNEGIIWDAEYGMRRVVDWLIANNVNAPKYSQIADAFDVARNGSYVTVVGFGNSGSVWEGWVAKAEFGGSVFDILPSSFTVLAGNLLQGDITSLLKSDDSKVIVESSSRTEKPQNVIEVKGICPITKITQLEITVESSASIPNILQGLYLFNYETNSFELIDLRESTLSDSKINITIGLNNNAKRFVSSTGEITAQVRWETEGLSALKWKAITDLVHWRTWGKY